MRGWIGSPLMEQRALHSIFPSDAHFYLYDTVRPSSLASFGMSSEDINCMAF